MDIIVAIALVALALIIFKTLEAFVVAAIVAAICVWVYRKFVANSRPRY